MKIKVVGFVLTLVFGITVAYLISMGLAGIILAPPGAIGIRFVSPIDVYVMIQSLSYMLWQYRGIDLVVQGVLLFVGALAASVFFYEVTRKPTETKEKE